MFVDFNILNQFGSPSINSNTFANRPAAGQTGRLFVSTDTFEIFRDNGTGWDLIGGGSASETPWQIAFKALGSSITGYLLDNAQYRITSALNLVDQQIFFTAYYMPVAKNITGVGWWQAGQGVYTANNYNGVALYSYSAGTLTLVASSNNDGDIWKAGTQTWNKKAFSATYSAAAGIYYIAAIYCRSAQTTVPSIGSFGNISSNANSYDFTNNARITAAISTQTSLAATYLTTSFISQIGISPVLTLY